MVMIIFSLSVETDWDYMYVSKPHGITFSYISLFISYIINYISPYNIFLSSVFHKLFLILRIIINFTLVIQSRHYCCQNW